LLSLCFICEPPVGFVECERIAVTGHDHVVVIIDDHHATVVVDGMVMPSRFAESIAPTIRFLAKIIESVPVCYDDFFHSVSPRLSMKESPLRGDVSTCGLLALTKRNSSETQLNQAFFLENKNYPQPHGRRIMDLHRSARASSSAVFRAFLKAPLSEEIEHLTHVWERRVDRWTALGFLMAGLSILCGIAWLVSEKFVQ
jgi:hypothetical protein